MPASFQEILNSPTAIFTVGAHGSKSSEFIVHAEAIAQLSQPLHALIDGLLPGKSEIWPDVSKTTFERLAQFAYTGDYTVPVPGLLPIQHVSADELEAGQNEPSPDTLNGTNVVDKPSFDGDLDVREAVPVEEDSWGNMGWGARTTKKKSKKATREPEPKPELEPVTLPDFPSLSFLIAPHNNHHDTCEPGEHFDPSRYYSDIFLCHAELWTLADTYEIAALKALALFKLHKSLCVFKVSGRNGSEVITLVRYAYSKEGLGQDRPDDPEEGLRGLVARYMAANAFVLSRHVGFMLLLSEGGQFVRDFVRLVVQGRY
ncbi:hypothetical protein V493_08156 [Pseudogymnoascus sp. VKM F-4281 (FW-2241)]|nr:hypothetical protein V493_08156 [Pseudogymnoascus sp. VKM F-4281 (FW-2241)]